MLSINKKTYNDAEDWKHFFNNKKKIKDIPIDPSWKPFFDEYIFNDKRFQGIENKIKEDVYGGSIIAPKPIVLFNTFYVTPIEDVKVVIIGQDPYFNIKDNIPEAVGLSFSVPNEFPIPSSLKSIYDNLKKYNNIAFTPKNGNLIFWAIQGCIMLNTALSVQINKKKSHANIWKWVTDEIIKYISYNCDHVVFLLWGADAFDKSKFIDLDKHDIITSSHPSGLSRHKPFKNFKSFDNTNHFTMTNELLVKHKQEPIIWQVP